MPQKETSDNAVGYRRPPVAHQFKKGQSGNPKGRRKGSVSAVSHVAKARSMSMPVRCGSTNRILLIDSAAPMIIVPLVSTKGA